MSNGIMSYFLTEIVVEIRQPIIDTNNMAKIKLNHILVHRRSCIVQNL